MNENVIVSALVLSALIHVPPVLGALGGRRVARLYGVRVDGPDLAVLLVHRAVLFGVLAAALLVAVWQEELRGWVIGGVLIADAAFLVVAWAHRGLNAAMRRVVVADVVSVLALGVAAVLL